MLNQVLKSEPFVAGRARNDKIHEHLKHQWRGLSEFTGRVFTDLTCSESVGFKLVGKTPGAVELAALVVDTFNRDVYDVYQ
jgi:hypothetical protein